MKTSVSRDLFDNIYMKVIWKTRLGPVVEYDFCNVDEFVDTIIEIYPWNKDLVFYINKERFLKMRKWQTKGKTYIWGRTNTGASILGIKVIYNDFISPMQIVLAKEE